MANQDFALQNNDIIVQNGDFAIAESDSQHIADTLNAFPGWWKQYPQDGVGVFSFFNSAGQEQKLKRSIQIQLTSDGYKVNNAEVNVDASGNLSINPNAIANANV